MSVSHRSLLSRALFISILFLLPAVGQRSVHADLWQGGFETNLGWTGTDLFMGETATEGPAVNAARFFDFIDSDTIAESGVWIEDATRTYEGNRMYWLRDYNDPDTICLGKRFTGLTPGEVFDLEWHFAAFDPDNPNGTSALTSKPIVEVMSWDSSISDWVLSEPVLNFGDGQTTDYDNGIVTEYEVQDWDNLTWTSATSRFEVPELNGQPLYVWVSMTNDSAGLLVDSITFTAVPEPGSMVFLSFAMMALAGRRKRSKGTA